MLKKQQIVLLYPYGTEYRALSIVFSNGFIGVYTYNGQRLNKILYEKPSYRQARSLYKYRILRRHLPSYIYEKMKNERSIHEYYQVFLKGQYTAGRCII